MWTLDRLFEMNQQITNTRIKVVNGVKQLPLLMTLEVDGFLPHAMHIMLGMIGNNLLDDCFKFLDALHEWP